MLSPKSVIPSVAEGPLFPGCVGAPPSFFEGECFDFLPEPYARNTCRSYTRLLSHANCSDRNVSAEQLSLFRRVRLTMAFDEGEQYLVPTRSV